MSFIPNTSNTNSAYDASLADNAHEPAFSGNALFKPITYKDFLPNDTTKLRSTQKKTDSNAWFNSTFKSPTYKDFMPQHPLSNRKNMSVSAWIGSILGGTVGISLLGFFGRAHFNGGLLKDGIKNTWNDFTKFLGIASNKGTGGASSTRSPSKVLTGTLNQRLDIIKTQFTPGHVFTTEELKDHFFQEDSKKFKQTNSTLCYLLSGLGAMVHHSELEQYLEKITITRQADGFDIKFLGQTKTIHRSDKELLDKNMGVKSNSPGIQLLASAYTQCDGFEAGQDDSVDALMRIFEQKDVIRITAKNSAGGLLTWDPIRAHWIDDGSVEQLQALQKLEKLSTEEKEAQLTELQKQKKFQNLRTFEAEQVSPEIPSTILNRLEPKNDPTSDANIEGQEFKWHDRVEVLKHYLQWLKTEPEHLALLTAHTGSYKSGHYYAIVPHLAKDDDHICLMDTFFMGDKVKAKQVRIDQFFDHYDLWGHIDESKYPGNSLTKNTRKPVNT
jgi:hypothetical protein